MKYIKIILFIVFAVCLQPVVNAQISYGGKPVSQTRSLSADIDHLQLRAPDMEKLRQEDLAAEKNAQLQRIGEILYVDIDMENSGTWDVLDDGRHVWRLQVSSENALALGLYFDEFHLPTGSQLFVYSPDKLQVLGAYNEKNNANGGNFAIELVYGESLILEYISPRPRVVSGREKDFENLAGFHLNRVNYVYRQVSDPYRDRGFGDSQACEVNINCSEGNNWQDEKRGVARILIDGGSFSAWCTGSLVNNTNQDGTPYFLSAWHCREGINEVYLDSWVFYFNFEFSGCSSSFIQPGSNTITGAETKADAELNGGSDMLLMELNSTPPASYEVVYNGWDRLNASSSSGAGIHHPYGDVKKISTYTSSLSSATYYGGFGSNGASNAHWRVYWAETANGHGVTEGGSSGSPLFNNDGLIVGTLSGGSSSCEAPTSPDLYGKFSYHWASNGSSSSEQLSPWLDPAGTGQTELDFYDPNNSGVEASFTASPTSVSEGGTVQFSSTSTGSIDSYSWSFPGGSPSSSAAQNPSVTYNTAGIYSVTLTVNGSGDSDTHTETNYITVTQGGGVDCAWLNYPLAGTASFYTTDGGSGYVSGTNSYGDLAKVNFFDHSGIGYVTKLGFNACAAQGTTSSIRLVVYSVSGGEPGTLLGYKTISMASVTGAFSEVGDYFEYTFDSPIQVNGDFFAGVELPGGSDIFALMTNTDGDSNPGTAWEQWSDGSWSDYVAGWDLNVDNAIYPEVCSSVGIGDLLQMDYVHAYPNPAKSVVTLTSDYLIKDAKLKIYNTLGVLVEEIKATDFYSMEIDMCNYTDGLYVFYLETEDGVYREKIQLMK